MNQQTYLGWLAWLYDFQTLFAGALALLAGVLAYLAGKHQANVTRSTGEQQIKSATELHVTERRDRAEQMVNTAANIVSQIQLEAAFLRRTMEIMAVEFERVPEMRAAGKVPVAENVTHRIDKIERLLAQVWPRLEPVPIPVSGPVGRLIVWLDDLATRCADFRTTLESGGHMPAEAWKKELDEIITGLGDLDRAISAFFADPSVDPADSLKNYQDARIAYSKNYKEQLKPKPTRPTQDS